MSRFVPLLSVMTAVALVGPTWAKDYGTVKEFLDIPYVENGDDDRNQLDLYVPTDAANAPVLFLHGGGYQKGDRKAIAQFGQTLATQGVLVVAAGYRLQPKDKYPAAVQDGARAFAWVKANIGRYGGAAQKLFVGGHSAGGDLALILSVDPKVFTTSGVATGDIKGVVSLSGGYKIVAERVYQFGGDEAANQASPLTCVRGGLPAFFLAYAENDAPGKDKQTVDFAHAVKSKNNIAVIFEAKDPDHSSLLPNIAHNDPTGAAILAFIHNTVASK